MKNESNLQKRLKAKVSNTLRDEAILSTRESWLEKAVPNKGNIWGCITCKRKVVSLDVDEGVTPFVISCPYCGSQASSAFYAKEIQEICKIKFTFVWQKMSTEELKKFADPSHELWLQMVNHLNDGGLVMTDLSGFPVREWTFKRLEDWKDSRVKHIDAFMENKQ